MLWEDVQHCTDLQISQLQAVTPPPPLTSRPQAAQDHLPPLLPACRLSFLAYYLTDHPSRQRIIFRNIQLGWCCSSSLLCEIHQQCASSLTISKHWVSTHYSQFNINAGEEKERLIIIPISHGLDDSSIIAAPSLC